MDGEPGSEMTRVLIVDDEAPIRLLCRVNLEAEQMEVIDAGDGPTGLEKARSEEPDVILLDVMMPEMDGMEVLDRIKANPQNAHIPVILVTAKAQDEDLLAGYKFGADYYITKPFTSRQLLYGIGLVLGREFPT
jgi:CheY-like chemotaxis protein